MNSGTLLRARSPMDIQRVGSKPLVAFRATPRGISGMCTCMDNNRSTFGVKTNHSCRGSPRYPHLRDGVRIPSYKITIPSAVRKTHLQTRSNLYNYSSLPPHSPQFGALTQITKKERHTPILNAIAHRFIPQYAPTSSLPSPLHIPTS